LIPINSTSLGIKLKKTKMQNSTKQSDICIADIEDEMHLITLTLNHLIKEREKIIRRGRLTAEEDRRLDQIDTEVDHWEQVLDNLEDYMYEIDQSYEENETHLE
jgi:hypothetical protein